MHFRQRNALGGASMSKWIASTVYAGILIVAFLSGEANAASTSFVRWGTWYGRTGGYAYRITCAPGNVAVGLTVRAGHNSSHGLTLVNQISLVCAPVLNNGTLGSPYEAGLIGGWVGTSSSLMCANGYALESIYGRSGWAIDRLGIRCRTLDQRNSYIGGSAGGYGGGEFWDAAAPGQFITHLRGESQITESPEGLQMGYSVINWESP
jgi:hypothetical protein